MPAPRPRRCALSRVDLIGRGIRRFSWGLAGLSVLGGGTFLTQGLFPLAALGGLLFAAWIASIAVVLRRRFT